MQKDFDRWNKSKKKIDAGKGTALFHEREVWWCSLGMNIGFEQDGSTDDFARPVIILKKYNLDACLIVPLTARQKTGRYYFPVGRIDNRDAVAVLSQVRFIDPSGSRTKPAHSTRRYSAHSSTRWSPRALVGSWPSNIA